MALVRFIISLFAFIGVLAGAAALVLIAMLMLRSLPVLTAIVLACLVFWWLLKKTGTSQTPG